MHYAIIQCDINSSDLGDVISVHRTEQAAERALDRLGDVAGVYLAHRNLDGEWERRLEARDRREFPVQAEAARLRTCGEALYGAVWQSELARAIGVGDRRVREWLAGERCVPPGVWSDIARVMRERAGTLRKIADRL